jgi:hypothetical protein
LPGDIDEASRYPIKRVLPARSILFNEIEVFRTWLTPKSFQKVTARMIESALPGVVPWSLMLTFSFEHSDFEGESELFVRVDAESQTAEVGSSPIAKCSLEMRKRWSREMTTLMGLPNPDVSPKDLEPQSGTVSIERQLRPPIGKGIFMITKRLLNCDKVKIATVELLINARDHAKAGVRAEKVIERINGLKLPVKSAELDFSWKLDDYRNFADMDLMVDDCCYNIASQCLLECEFGNGLRGFVDMVAKHGFNVGFSFDSKTAAESFLKLTGIRAKPDRDTAETQAREHPGQASLHARTGSKSALEELFEYLGSTMTLYLAISPEFCVVVQASKTMVGNREFSKRAMDDALLDSAEEYVRTLEPEFTVAAIVYALEKAKVDGEERHMVAAMIFERGADEGSLLVYPVQEQDGGRMVDKSGRRVGTIPNLFAAPVP